MDRRASDVASGHAGRSGDGDGIRSGHVLVAQVADDLPQQDRFPRTGTSCEEDRFAFEDECEDGTLLGRKRDLRTARSVSEIQKSLVKRTFEAMLKFGFVKRFLVADAPPALTLLFFIGACSVWKAPVALEPVVALFAAGPTVSQGNSCFLLFFRG